MEFFNQVASIALRGSEQFLREAVGVTLCETNSDKESNFSNGSLFITSHRLLWRDMACLVTLAVQLKNIKAVSEDHKRTHDGFPKLLLSFYQDAKVVKLVFTNFGSQIFLSCLSDSLQRKRWEIPDADSNASSIVSGSLSSLGISAVQKKIDTEQKSTDARLNAAFADIDKLMSSAQEMVKLSSKLAEKIRDGQGAINADETIEFKSVLLSMGIANPVTRQTSGNETKYHQQLAKQLCEFLYPIVKTEPGGTMSLADVYCRFNRARGVDLVSPDDILVACEQFGKLKLPLILRRFESGVAVIQLLEVNDEKVIEETVQLLVKYESLTAEELSRHLGVSVTLSRERLLLCEQKGKLCRDENVEGLKFYINKFMLMP